MPEGKYFSDKQNQILKLDDSVKIEISEKEEEAINSYAKEHNTSFKDFLKSLVEKSNDK
ncbi:hypothetical protein [Tepidibacter formicigenes]|jgi:predicted DNA binding CopG/RHH family protein|uniref:Uncharacterized protein n=1 Tax=Tepidibacter formicigenes DSM 15518 TaxID=1123349 RepID=A0A1M6M871_9FIRM|nr:hypothetical protein [Tepidibacter formicigenes]SHJ79636.1 hypothetical protein SAMN02744037_00848 [Tepidibacter formicigenes DSM 15518]